LNDGVDDVCSLVQRSGWLLRSSATGWKQYYCIVQGQVLLPLKPLEKGILSLLGARCSPDAANPLAFGLSVSSVCL
jgi:hypothetical protein